MAQGSTKPPGPNLNRVNLVQASAKAEDPAPQKPLHGPISGSDDESAFLQLWNPESSEPQTSMPKVLQASSTNRHIVPAVIASHKINAQLDSGADISLMDFNLTKNLNILVFPHEQPLQLASKDSKIKTSHITEEVEIVFGVKTVKHCCLVGPSTTPKRSSIRG